MLAEQRALHERALADAKTAQEKALADLRDAFKALSADALKQTAPEFLRLAEQSFGKFQETAKGDLAQRQEAIKGLVEPLKQQLESYQKRLQQSESAQSSTLGEVKKQLDLLSLQSQSLANETQQFRMVLKSNQARGRWGAVWFSDNGALLGGAGLMLLLGAYPRSGVFLGFCLLGG